MTQDIALWGLLLSQINEVWVRQNASTFETRLTYTPTDAFETLPIPRQFTENIPEVVNLILENRCDLCKEYAIGLTDFYNRFHNKDDKEPDIERLRELQCQLDTAVAAAYGWNDLVLDHDFHTVPYLPENDRVRYTISEPARIEVLQRLSLLNRQRYQEEVEQGLHKKKATTTKRTKKQPSTVNEAQTEFGL